MGAREEVQQAQRLWAESKGIDFDRRGYVRDLKLNLQESLSSRAQTAYEAGAGHELDGDMRALHSSSALVVNVFDRWADIGDKRHLLQALGITSGDAIAFHFEKKFSTGLGGIPPHLDVAIRLDSNWTIGVESKFTEWMVKKTKVDTDFKEKYLTHPNGLWTQQKLPQCQGLAESVGAEGGGKRRFQFLGAEQLLKHALGLATQLGKGNFTLYYLYYDWPGESAEARRRAMKHEQEIADFCEQAGDEIRFTPLSYQELYQRLTNSLGGNAFYTDYLTYLGERYFPEIWAEYAS